MHPDLNKLNIYGQRHDKTAKLSTHKKKKTKISIFVKRNRKKMDENIKKSDKTEDLVPHNWCQKHICFNL